MDEIERGVAAAHVVSITTKTGFVELQELTEDGTVCRAADPNGNFIVGNTAEVLAAACDLPEDDPWVRAVADALQRERGWEAWGSGWGRAHGLEMTVGNSAMFHVTGCANRASIERWGLDWDRMGEVPGVAGSKTPEAPGIYLQEDEEDDFFVEMAGLAVEVWEVDVTDLWLERRPGGWWFTSERVPPERMRLIPPRHLAT